VRGCPGPGRAADHRRRRRALADRPAAALRQLLRCHRPRTHLAGDRPPPVDAGGRWWRDGRRPGGRPRPSPQNHGEAQLR
jgi:hypothetical protein